MRVIVNEVSRKDCPDLSLFPIGDVHIGAKACDEKALKEVIKHVKDTPNARWIGMGDYCDFINIRDPRHDPSVLADWIGMSDLTDLARAQKEYFVNLVRPIADKCVGLLQGNHEASIIKYSERDIYSEIVTAVKTAGGHAPEKPLGLGYYGWVLLKFLDTNRKNRDWRWTCRLNCHHGFTGGRLAGAKALNAQRWAWTHPSADVVLMGHSHNTSVQVEQVEHVTAQGKVYPHNITVAYTGSYLRSSVDGVTTYSERMGMLPMPVSRIAVHIKPNWALPKQNSSIRIETIPTQ
jgi:hypothetical protein